MFESVPAQCSVMAWGEGGGGVQFGGGLPTEKVSEINCAVAMNNQAKVGQRGCLLIGSYSFYPTKSKCQAGFVTAKMLLMLNVFF